jgi:PRTRC genetic system protein E
MFPQLVPLLRQRSVLFTVTLLEEDQVRVNVMPKKLADSENTALTTPMSFTGTAQELDTQLPSALVSYVARHLELKNTLEKAKEEMAAAGQGGTRRSAEQIEERQENLRHGDKITADGREGGRKERRGERPGSCQSARALRRTGCRPCCNSSTFRTCAIGH